MSKKPETTPEDILKIHRREVQAIAQKLRQIVKDVIPDVMEKAYPGWHGIGYRHPKTGYFGCIFPLDDKVRFAFEYGAFLPDPDNLLIRPPTSSKQVRYVELNTVGEIRGDEFVALLHAAISVKQH
jgi:hypothetical protein